MSSKSEEEHGLSTFLPFPLLADHSQSLTRKFDLLDSNQGSAKNALLLMDPKGLVQHKQIGENNVAFSVEEALSLVLSYKIPIFDKTELEGTFFNVFYLVK